MRGLATLSAERLEEYDDLPGYSDYDEGQGSRGHQRKRRDSKSEFRGAGIEDSE
jgi:hypothetical protein